MLTLTVYSQFSKKCVSIAICNFNLQKYPDFTTPLVNSVYSIPLKM